MILAFAAAAWATEPDLFGAGARASGLGGGGVALVDDGDAARINPAGLADVRRPTVAAGINGGLPRFAAVPDLWWDTNRDGRVDADDPPLAYDVNVDPIVGLNLSHGKNVGKKFALGISLYVPVQRLLRFSTFEPSLPSYFLYDNRPQRYTFALGVGGHVWKGLSVGASVDLLPAARYRVAMTIDATLTSDVDENGDVEQIVGDVAVDVHEMDLDLVPGFAPIVGVQVDFGKFAPALDGLWLGLVWQGSIGLPISVDLDLQTNVALADVGDLEPWVFAAILDAGLGLYDHYKPMQLTGGLAWRSPRFSATADLKWTDWRPMTMNVARLDHLTVTSPIVNLGDVARDGNGLDVRLRPTVAARVGAEVVFPTIEAGERFKYVQIVARAGGGWEPTPLVSQGADTAVLDASRWMATAGLGVETWDPFDLIDGPVRIDGYGQLHGLVAAALPRSSATPRAGFPVDADAIPIGGGIVVGGVQIGFDY